MSRRVAERGCFAFIDESFTPTANREPLHANRKIAEAGRSVAFSRALACFTDHSAHRARTGLLVTVDPSGVVAEESARLGGVS